MTTKRYTISYDYTYDVVVDIDHDVMSDGMLHEMNNFWSGAKERLNDENGNVTRAVLNMLAMRAFVMSITDLDPEGMFRRGEVEGWYPMDGSEGMTLVSIDYFELDEDNLSIKEKTL